MANGLNQYVSAGPASFTYDPNGNLTSDGAVTYAYDIENRIVGASGAKTANLRYDPLGRLYEVNAGSASSATRFLYDGDALVAEYDGSSGAISRRYIHGSGVDEPLIWYEGADLSNRRSLRANHQASIIAVAGPTGEQIGALTYDPYGIPGAANFGRFQYTGQIWLKELGVYHYKARAYSPTLGRFLQTDPIGYEDQVNLYAYVGSDPVNRTDPTGLYLCDGNKTECGAVSKALNTVRDAVSSGKLSKSEVRTLNGVLKTYGAEGKKNGVVVTFRTGAEINKLAGGSATAVTAWSDKYKSAVVVLPHSFGSLYNGQAANPMAGGIRHPDRFSPQDERGNVIAHEGQHAQDQLRAGGYAGTNDANAERRGYAAGRAVNRANGTLPARDLYGPDQGDE